MMVPGPMTLVMLAGDMAGGFVAVMMFAKARRVRGCDGGHQQGGERQIDECFHNYLVRRRRLKAGYKL